MRVDLCAYMPYTHYMSTQHTPEVKYTLVINERQRHYIEEALNHFIGNDPGWDLDANGRDIPTALAYDIRTDEQGLVREGIVVDLTL